MWFPSLEIFTEAFQYLLKTTYNKFRPLKKHVFLQPHIIDPPNEVVVWVTQDVKLHDFENIDLIYSNYIIQHQNGNWICLAQQEHN